MAKITLATLTASFASITNLNANFTAIANAFENTLSRDGTTPNAMADDLDMDSNSILNLPQATTATEPVRFGDITAEIAAAGVQSQGAWTTAAAYTENNLVTNDGSTYIASADHTSGASTEPGVGASWETVWFLAAAKGDTGATGAAGADGADGADGSGLFDGTEATVTPAASDRIALLDASDSDNPKYAAFSSFGAGGTAPTRVSQALSSGSTVDVSIPSGCTRLVFMTDGDITVSATSADLQARLVYSSTEETVTGISEEAGSGSSHNGAAAFAFANSGSGTTRRLYGSVEAVRQARTSIAIGVAYDTTTGTLTRHSLTDSAQDYDTLRFVTSGTFSSGTVEIEFYYN